MKCAYKFAEISVRYRPRKPRGSSSQVKCSQDAYDALRPYFPASTILLQENFVVIYLDRANQVIGVYRLSKGGISGTVADPRLILGVALKLAASGIVLAHNHPSGNPQPSSQDRELTQKLSEASKLFDFRVLDHLILAGETYLSFADSGYL